MLKNDGVLPIKIKEKLKILVVGKAAGGDKSVGSGSGLVDQDFIYPVAFILADELGLPHPDISKGMSKVKGDHELTFVRDAEDLSKVTDNEFDYSITFMSGVSGEFADRKTIRFKQEILNMQDRFKINKRIVHMTSPGVVMMEFE